MYLYNKEEYWIGEYDDHTCERWMAQFLNCATPGTEEKNNSELVQFTRDSKRWLAAKITALDVKVVEQLLTRYGGRKVVSIEYIARECPAHLRNTSSPIMEFSPTIAHDVIPTDFYGCLSDRSHLLCSKPS